MVARPPPGRIALVTHPTRAIGGPLATIERWAGEHRLEIVQIPVLGALDREVARRGTLEADDLMVAVGGDGTVLSALRAAAREEVPVLGVACGSLAALAAVDADGLKEALERVRSGDWTERRLPALSIHPADAEAEWALNDFVVIRHAAGQMIVDLSVDDELYVRLAGDGLIVATPLGSSAYSMAAGGPLLGSGIPAMVCTPVAMHGGSAAPIVVPGTADVRVTVQPSFGGFVVELDGHAHPIEALDYRVRLHPEKATLVSFGPLELGLSSLRRRGLIADSPRVLARDARAT